MTDRDQRDRDEPTVPDKLARDLADLMAPQRAPSAAVNQRILAEADRRLRRVRNGRRIRRLLPAMPLAAALLLLLLWIGRDRAPVSTRPQARSGVTVIDVFAMARALRDGGELRPNWDLDGDGQIDERDLALIVEEAARL